MNTTTKKFLDWYEQNKRDLPWRKTKDPYKIWVSEIFLQQTQVSRVIYFYERFLTKFPRVEDLAASTWEEFLPYFQGLGFYSRGRNMLKTADAVVKNWNGVFSDDIEELQKLPGVGKYTASAICSFAYRQNVPAFDTNLYRVMGRFFGILEKDLEKKKVLPKNIKKIEEKAQFFYDSGEGELLNHAFMDLGSSLCTSKKADCVSCPLSKKCDFFQTKKKLISVSSRIIKIEKSEKISQEYSVLVLHHEKQYFLMLDASEKNKFGFPVFENTEKKDHRHFLKEQVLKQYGIQISVRPPFFEKIISNNIQKNSEKNSEKTNIRYKFSRCKILHGEIIPSTVHNFFTLSEVQEKASEGNISAFFLGEMFEKLVSMRF